jgi:hypothetical protein
VWFDKNFDSSGDFSTFYEEDYCETFKLKLNEVFFKIFYRSFSMFPGRTMHTQMLAKKKGEHI